MRIRERIAQFLFPEVFQALYRAQKDVDYWLYKAEWEEVLMYRRLREDMLPTKFILLAEASHKEAIAAIQQDNGLS